jgi:hypothetical protein
MNHQLKKPRGWKERKILRFTLPLAIAIFLTILYELLPETGKLWLDWFRFPPNFIVRLGAILLLFTVVFAVSCLLGHFRRKGGAGVKSMEQEHKFPRENEDPAKSISRGEKR